MKTWELSSNSLVRLVLGVFILGIGLSPFTKSCSSEQGLVRADTENPLLKSKSVQTAMVVQESIREIYREVNPSVVRVETEQTIKSQNPFMNDPFLRRFFGIPNQPQKNQKQTGLGSGFIISGDGYIVTNQHVVQNVDKITVVFVNGKRIEAKLIGADSSSDIALLKVKDSKGIKVAHLGDSDKLEVGDFAIAIGNPFGLSSTFTFGVISATGQDVQAADGVARIQTDAAINPGNSGGPLLNLRGEVIGINQMIVSRSGGSNGIGFAIPINYAIDVVEKLKSGKKIIPGYIGVSVYGNVTDTQMRDLGLKGKVGLLVAQVILSSPAWNAGLRAYDFITKIDGEKADKFTQLKSAVIRKGPGKKIKLSIIRDGRKKTVTIKIGAAPKS